MAGGGIRVDDRTLLTLMTDQDTISVPIYQRDYSWKNTHIEELLNDIESEIPKRRADRALFLGTLVFNDEPHDGTDQLDLIDGQQRLVTLSLVVAALVHKLRKAKAESTATEQNLLQLLYSEPAANLTTEEIDNAPLRLRCSQRDNPNYEALIRKGKGAKPGRSRILRGWKTVNEQLDLIINTDARTRGIDLEDEGVQRKQVVRMADEIHDVIANRIRFGVIEVSKPHNPYAVFESLNSKNLPLAQSDLIKNLLLSRLSGTKVREEIASEWDEIMEVVGPDRGVDFLRYWYEANFKFVPRKQVYSVYRDVLKTKEDIRDALDKWREDAWWFWAFTHGRFHDDHPAYQKVKVERALERALRDWSHVDFKQGTPVLMALVRNKGFSLTEKESQKMLAGTLRLLEGVYVRLFFTKDVRGSVVESKIGKLCQAAREKGNPAGELGRICHEMCDANGVGGTLDWGELDCSNVDQTRFILYRIAEHQALNSIELVGPDRWHVEHILPQTKPKGYSPKEGEDYDRMVHRIGNVTLLLNSDNQSLKNADPLKKYGVYRLYDGKSSTDDESDGGNRPRLQMVSDIPVKWPKAWGGTEIRERGAVMGQYASKVWPVTA